MSNTGGQIEYWAQFGPTTAYGSESAHQTVTGAQNAFVSVVVSLTGLQAATVYHYRLCARDSQQQGGPGCGDDRRLTTPAVDCGDTITSDVKLNTDVFCAQQPGLIVGADGVDIDLAGHQLDGDTVVGGGGPTGIDNSGGFDDLTVRNGSMTLWGFAILIHGGERNRILNVDAFGANTGIRIEGGADDEIQNGDVSGRSVGIAVAGSDRMLVSNNDALGSFGSAITVTGDAARIVDNRVVRTGFGGEPGIVLVGSNGRIARNLVAGGWHTGISTSGSGNVIVDNEASGALDGSANPAAFGDGIFVGPFSAGTLLRRNFVHDNADDGIETQDATSRLGDNRANQNGDLGIDAVAGVTDLGGNSASGNGNPLQCRNVFCAASP